MLDNVLTLPYCFLSNLIPPVRITGEHFYAVSYTTLSEKYKNEKYDDLNWFHISYYLFEEIYTNTHEIDYSTWKG